MTITLRSLLSVAGGASAPTANSHGAHHVHAGHAKPVAPAPPGNSEAYRHFTEDMRSGMDKMMSDMHADPPSGDPDIDFLRMMIPHHWGATDMARLALQHGRDPIVREVAEMILASQTGEIEGMRGRLAALTKKAEDYPALTGNRG